MPKELSLYIHWPFCKSKCPYCDFNSHVREQINEQDFAEAYLKEIDYFKDFLAGKIIKTIYFGGGTPSLMSTSLVEKILRHLLNYLKFDSKCEITLEANPTSSEAKKFSELKQIGVNRLSIGVQSMQDKNLKFLGREHSVKDALAVVETAAKYFDNYSFDLIYSLPNQNINDWLQDLDNALNYTAKHISLYQLTIEKGTPFYQAFNNNKFTLPNEDKSAKLYQATIDKLLAYGFHRYEVSNFAKSGFESQHNLAYWQYKPYLGIGAGAHSRLHHGDGKIESLMMIHNPENWLKNVTEKRHAIQHREILNENQILNEKLLMGLRLKDGLALTPFKNFISISRLNECIEHKLLTQHNNMIKATDHGFLKLNSIINYLTNYA